MYFIPNSLIIKLLILMLTILELVMLAILFSYFYLKLYPKNLKLFQK